MPLLGAQAALPTRPAVVHAAPVADGLQATGHFSSARTDRPSAAHSCSDPDQACLAKPQLLLAAATIAKTLEASEFAHGTSAYIQPSSIERLFKHLFWVLGARAIK
jgi:hypothetical protein